MSKHIPFFPDMELYAHPFFLFAVRCYRYCFNRSNTVRYAAASK